MGLLDDPIEVIECEQGTDAWFAARTGVVTASCFSDVMAGGRSGAPSKTRLKLLYTLAAEILSGQPTPGWGGNEHTERGKRLEPGIRMSYAAASEHDVTEVGFVKRGRIGASPDSLVGDEGLLEIKTALPHIQIERLEAGTLPAEHVAQVQGQLLVTGRKWADYRSEWPGLPPLAIRVFPDLPYQSRLLVELESFIRDLDRVVARYRRT